MDDERYESEELFSNSLVFSVSGDGIAVAVERCPLCLRTRRPFYCKDCVNAGNFSRKSETERYSDLQEKLKLLTSERLNLVQRIGQSVAAKEASAAKQDEIEGLRIRIRLLKWSIKETRERKIRAEKLYANQRRAYRQNAEKLQRSHDSVPKMQATYTASKKKLQGKAEELEDKNCLLRDERLRVIEDLVQYIFPVVELTAEGASSYSMGLEESSLLLSMARQLSEACQLTYMSGQWVHTDRYGNTLIKIVESTLPGNGDYSAGVTNERQELVSLTEDRQRSTASNPTYAVISGLCYTTQLVQILSYILHVILPRKISYSTFGCNDFSEKQLQQAVSRLNHNILYLCFAQGVSPTKMISRHTMHNLLLLLRSEHLGKELAFRDSPRMLEAVNEGCQSEDDSDDDEVGSPQDWDFVVRGDLPEVSVPESESWSYSPAAFAGHMLSGTQSTASGLVTSAAASVASLWRTATGSRYGDS